MAFAQGVVVVWDWAMEKLGSKIKPGNTSRTSMGYSILKLHVMLGCRVVAKTLIFPR